MKQNSFITLKEIKNVENEIFQIIKGADSINLYFKENLKKLDANYLITPQDAKLFQFIFKYFFNSLKYKDIKIFFRLQNKKIICKQDQNKYSIPKNLIEKTKYIVSKFINFCLFYHLQLSKFFHITDSYFIDNVLKITKILFLNDFINDNDFKIILFLQTILCLYKNNEKFDYIQNVKQLYLVIDYLLSFCSNNNYNIKNYKLGQFNNSVNYFVDIITEYILSNYTNYNNKHLLARNKYFYNLIGLSQITSISTISKIIKMLVSIYAHQLNIDYVLDDLSEQFLYKTKKESLENKTNLLMAKNNFLNDLLEKEKSILKGEDIFIKNGFYFTDCPNNGIICDSINKFPNENDGYSIVVSFRLMNNNKNKDEEKNIYTIFTLMNKDTNIFHVFIEDNKLKFKVKKEKKNHDLYEISNNSNYVLWIIQSKAKKHKIIFYLNNCKNVLNNIPYPEGYFKINLGFNSCNNSNNSLNHNFVGIIGTFILFKKCLIKDENDNINITKLTELKGNYEDIIYISSIRHWGFIEKNLNWILNKMSNDIDIYKDIEIIISTKSLGNLDLLYDSNNILDLLQPDFYCNYFQNSTSKNEVKFYFKNNITLKNNLNFPLKLENSFIGFLNNHIFLYLQLELYYFISLLSLKLDSKDDKTIDKNKIKIFSNFNDEEEFYLNITKICSLFFYCIDLFCSVTWLNSTQEKLVQNEIDNFKYTLIDLISIYSKYGCQIKTYFLSLFAEKINEKKYFDYCLFILTFEYYDMNNNEVFDVLFNYLNHMSLDDYDNEQIKKMFEKLLDFDKIYLSKNIQKSTKKEYSKFMRTIIRKIISDDLNKCFSPYRKKLRQFKQKLEKTNKFKNEYNIQEEEDYINECDKKYSRTSIDEIYNDNISKTKGISRKESTYKNENDESNTINNNEDNNENNLDILILLYKYLKNLYIGINNIKKKFIQLFSERKNNISEYLNKLFNSLCEIYPIEDDSQFLKFASSEADKKEILVAELIKCLCIRFLDDFFFEENLKVIKEEESKKHDKNDENDSKKGSSGNLKNSFNSCKTNPGRNNSKLTLKLRNDSSNNLINSLNPLNTSRQSSFISNNNYVNNSIEMVLTSKMEFFNNIILSQYTFKSYYLMLFRDELSNDKKIKIIKDDKYLKNALIINDKNFPKTRYLLRVIILLFEKQNSEGCETVFMPKIKLIEYSYNVFIDLMKNTLDNYLKSNEERKKKLKPMINHIFGDKSYNLYGFYKIMIDDIISNFKFNGCQNIILNNDLIKNSIDQLLIKVQDDLKDFINKTLFELKDPFYFNLLIEVYFQNDKNNEFIINIILSIIEKIITQMDNKNKIVEINCKNILILLYKMFFYIKKQYLILYTENDIFLKNVIIFLSKFIENCNILYTKILFPIEDFRGKLLIEIIFEIIFEMHLDFLRNQKIQSLQVAATLLKNLCDEKNIKKNLSGHIKHKKSSKNKNEEEKEIYSPFYLMDKISYFTVTSNKQKEVKISDDIIISNQFYILKDYILLKYKDEIKENNDLFSVCILFAIKIILSIKELEDFYINDKKKNNINLSQTSSGIKSDNICTSKALNYISESKSSEDLFLSELKTQFVNLCKNILKIHIDHTSKNPFKSIGYYAKNLYEYFRSFIVDKFSFEEMNPFIKIDELKGQLNQYKNDIKYFSRVIYTKEGRTKMYTEKTYNQIIKGSKNDNLIKDNESVGSFNEKSRHSSEGGNSLVFSNSLKGSFVANNNDIGASSVKSLKKIGIYMSVEGAKSQNHLLSGKRILLNKSIYNNNYYNNKNIYVENIKFKKDLIRTYFSSYFKTLLTYDEDFLNIKNLYILTYNKDIKHIDDYGILYPTRLKNYITNNYNKMFLKRDFDFFTDNYFKNSHKYLYNKKYKYKYNIQNKLLFPNKKLINENDSAHKEIQTVLSDLITYECEMITVKGSIFGKIYVFDNCLLFKSELKNDKREKELNNKEEYYFDYACCTVDYDHIKIDKKIVLEFNNIKEVVNRTFFYSWISFEIFLKNGKSFLFNLFVEETNYDMLEFLKQKKIPVIRKATEYFRKEEFAKKWREEKITTFDYILLLNKFSSRTYNDPNQYPIMPWIFLEEGLDFIRNFDLPISVQDEDKKEAFLSKTENFIMEENTITHGNHYSTSAYICFYLMRANPFTNNMIKFQSDNFDIPDRQYSDMKQTIFLCQKMNNNREMIPELFSIPEIYINLNDNDFGERKDGVRVHNITFDPYAENPIEFSYIIKNKINNNIEINNKINKWFDFIFGVNQLGSHISDKSNNLDNKEKEKLKQLRRFNSYCYGQFYNIKKIYSEAQKSNKSKKQIYDDIKTNINISISFGQCPYQLLNEVHPCKKKSLILSDSCSNITTKTDISIFNDNNKYYKEYNNIFINKKVEDIYKIKGSGEILYFGKSSKNNYLYCLLSNKVFEIYKYNNKTNTFVILKSIIPKSQFLFLKRNKNNYLIFRAKYIFCEFDENTYICCRTLDKTLKYYNYSEDVEASFLLKSYATCILNINNNQFITGHDNGHICKWGMNYSSKDKKVELELLMLIKSNNKSITCLTYNEKLNIIITCDYNTIVIRKSYDLEYLNLINIENKDNFKKYIVDVKISDYNFLYALIYVEEKDIYELQGFTMNGTYFGKSSMNISNFQITKTGRIIVAEINEPTIKVLDPINFTEIYQKKLNIKGENTYYYFYFEMPNLIYYGIRNNDSSRIKMIFLEQDEEKYFI